ncbi:uncharacterized protein Ptip [Epargyreus clarus]|uniref:uncharacterized protein Ptip n=1 Tax=Epargyreus clarus TaxID=520877 RepID=UPI003C2FFF1F
MVTIVDDLDSLTLQEQIFKDVKYYISGDVSERIMLLLQSGGAENTKYFSDYVTHLICGQNAADTDLDDAQDIYQIPAVTENWVLACARLKRLASPKPYFPNKNKVFSNVVACVARVNSTDAKTLFALITYHGGKVKLNLDSQCTHLICGSAVGKKYSAALSLPHSIKIVTPDWVLESLRARIQAVAEVFHPKLLIVPQPPPKSMDRISAITGFDFEEGIAKNEVPTQNMTESKDDSTQALLDKLKQRMPWNHPPTTANSSVVITSGVNSMGYTTAMSTSSIVSKSIPPGIVTQNVQIQGSQANTQLMQKFGQNTIASQGINVQGQQINLQQQQQQQQQQTYQTQQSQQPHGLSAIQIQQQKLLQQHQLRMQMLQQKTISNQQSQQGFSQPNVSVAQMNQNISSQIQQHIQSNQHHIQQSQNISQSPATSMSSAQQQIENISQMLSQSANNLQQAQLNQQNMAMKQGLTLSQQSAVQNIAQQLAQSTQNLQQSLQNAKLNQNLGQSQVLNQQQILNSGQQLSSQNQGLIQQQTVQSLTNQQNINMGVVNQQGLVTSSQGQSNQNVQLNQLVGNTTQQSVIGQQIQTVQQNIQGQQGGNVPVQSAWRQQNIQMVQNVQGQHQIIRSPLVQSRNQSQVILQQQIMQTQQQALISNQQQQLSPQHTIQQNPQQILQQSINSQGQTISQTHHQILVQKQQLLNGSGQQQIVQTPQQVLINQHTGQQQILVHGNQQVTLQGGQQIVSQSQIVHQGGQIVNQGGQQIITQGGQQVLSQGGQHVITQQGQQHQVVIAQSSQQIVTQSGQQIIGQTVGQSQQVLSQVPQSPQPSQLSGSGIQQIITHSGGQQIVSPGGQQIVQGGQNVGWQQQQYLQQRQQLGQPGSVGPRVSWTAGSGGRQLIHLDAQTHAQLQQMDPQQRAMFVAQLQKRRQLSIQRACALAQQQQPGVVSGSPGAQSPAPAPQSVTFIRSQLPPGLSQQQQVQWLQQQGARAALPAAAPAPPPVGGAVGGTVGAVGGATVGGAVETSLLQRQQYQRLQQLQAQRDHAAHHHAAAKQVAPVAQHVAAPLQEQQVDALLTPPTPDQQQGAGALLVNPKTKTALANMLSIRLQSTNAPPDHEPSAAGTLRLMTAAHAAGSAVRAPARLLLGPAHHPHQVPTPAGSAGVVGNKVYAGAVRAAPPRAQFYGHNPNLKLPPDLFLLGCVFHIVEYQQSVGSERVSKWTEAIQRRGGEVEAVYCARVTHVLCETQRHGVVMQALRDAKRCVTAYWLSDAMERRGVAPPWQALHLPSMHAPRERPARHHRAALSGWRRDERRRLACSLRHLGAKLTPYMSRDNTVLICKRAEGGKYRRAREWGVPVVSAAWLTDLLLGNMTALAQIENAKYQQFNLASPFRMDYSLVSHLMNAWKMPINITQESHERAKRSAAAAGAALGGRRAKRARPPPSPPPAQPPAQPPPLQLAPRVLFSAVPQHDAARLAAIVRQLGGLVVTSAAEATHLIMEKLVRTAKLVTCLTTVKHLLTPEWVLESQRLNKFADEAKHALRDEAFAKEYNCDVSEVLLCGEQRRKLFEGITFYLTPCVMPQKSALTEMIELCGGKVEKNRRSFVSIQEIHSQRPYSYLILTVPNDLHLVYYLLQSEKTLNIVCNTEVVLSAIMRQKLEIQEFLVQVD